MSRHLRPYQRAGVRFLFAKCFGGEAAPACSSQGRTTTRGAILADDMGLGKTVQVIALLSALLRRSHRVREDEARVRAVRFGRARPERVFLVVAPASVLFNWEGELNRHWRNFQLIFSSQISLELTRLPSFQVGSIRHWTIPPREQGGDAQLGPRGEAGGRPHHL